MAPSVKMSTSVACQDHVIQTQPVLTLLGHTAVVANQDSLEMGVPVLTSTSVIITHAIRMEPVLTMLVHSPADVTMDTQETELIVMVIAISLKRWS